MTIEEALTSTVNFPLPAAAITKALIDAELDGTASYAPGDAKAIDLCMAGLLFTLITSADVTEDDVSIKLPSRDVLMQVREDLLGKWGLADKPTVRRVNVW